MNTIKLFSGPIAATLLTPFLLTVTATAAQADDGHESGGAFKVLQSADIGSFAGTPVKGGGTLLRSRNAVRARLSTMGLDPGAAYTVWWVVFNRPQHCNSGACGDDDLFINGDPNQGLNLEQVKKVDISVLYADGFVVGMDMIANVVAELETGRVPMMADVLFGNGIRRGNGFRAEIHMVIRTHGQAVAGQVDIQTSTFDGYCDVQTCEDQQFIVFPPAF